MGDQRESVYRLLCIPHLRQRQISRVHHTLQSVWKVSKCASSFHSDDICICIEDSHKSWYIMLRMSSRKESVKVSRCTSICILHADGREQIIEQNSSFKYDVVDVVRILLSQEVKARLAPRDKYTYRELRVRAFLELWNLLTLRRDAPMGNHPCQDASVHALTFCVMGYDYNCLRIVKKFQKKSTLVLYPMSTLIIRKEGVQSLGSSNIRGGE